VFRVTSVTLPPAKPDLTNKLTHLLKIKHQYNKKGVIHFELPLFFTLVID
jgi:hypothetical protein